MMTTTTLFILLYASINFLLTLIWWTIPAWINLCRYKYNLLPKMIIWPMTPANFEKHTICENELAILTLAGILIAGPTLIIWIICKGTHVVGRDIVNRIAFSKEEKVQIALGTIEGKAPK